MHSLVLSGISVPITNPFNPFTVADATIPNFFPDGVLVSQSRPVFASAASTTPAHDTKNSLTGISSSTSELRGELGYAGDYFKTWNWELGFRYSRNEGQDLSVGEVSQPGLAGRHSWIQILPRRLILSWVSMAELSRRPEVQVYVTLHNSGEYELPIYYGTFNGDLFNLPAGPVSFAIGGEYDAPRFTRDRDALNNTFSTIGSVDGQSFRVNRDIWGIYEEVRVPFTSPTWNFPGFYSFEVDFAEREEWYSNNTSAVLPSGLFPAVPAAAQQV